MKLCAGERIKWPTTNFFTTQDHLLGASHGVPFIRIKANLVLPGLTLSAIQKLKLELIATQENDYIEKIDSIAAEGTHWLKNEVLSRLNRATKRPAASSTDDICELLEELVKYEQLKKQLGINNHQSLGNQAEYDLFRTLERSEQISTRPKEQSNISELICLIQSAELIDK